jgi:metallo-beta-lactamase class B
MRLPKIFPSGVIALGLGAFACAASAGIPADWTRPIEPFRVVGDVYYVGTKGLGAYLITSPSGHVLLDATLAQNAPQVERNIEKLGFRLKDVKLLIENHAHTDHVGGLAQLKADTGAPLWASAGDRWALENGRQFGDTDYGVLTFPAVKVDRVVHDGETVHVGPNALTAWLTPGHTRGCTTWSLPVEQAGRRLKVVFLCSVTVAGNKLVGNKAYPGIVTDFRRTFVRLKTMQADVVLTGHPEAADVLARHARQRAGDARAFVDPGELSRLVSQADSDFETELAKQAAAVH